MFQVLTALLLKQKCLNKTCLNSKYSISGLFSQLFSAMKPRRNSWLLLWFTLVYFSPSFLNYSLQFLLFLFLFLVERNKQFTNLKAAFFHYIVFGFIFFPFLTCSFRITQIWFSESKHKYYV